MDGRIDQWIDTQTERDGWKDRLMDRYTDRQIDGWMDD